jgi:hypothetical protein
VLVMSEGLMNFRDIELCCFILNFVDNYWLVSGLVNCDL